MESVDLESVKSFVDTLWVIDCAILVFIMQAGFMCMETGLSRHKNSINVALKNAADFGLAVVIFWLFGFGLMFGKSFNGYFGTDLFFFKTNQAEYMTYFVFQAMFVATAATIVSGAVAERMKLGSFLLFAVVMTGLIYPIQGYWKWGGGFLDAAGFSDFAGSGVVHLCGAAAALAGVILLGARKGKYENGQINAIPGANMPLATLGTFILWLGWFGFNGGSELIVSNVAEANAVALIFVNTNTAAAGGVVAALLFSKILFGKFDLSMSLNGAIGGLVSITAEPLAPTPELALLIGAIGGIIVVVSIILLDRVKIDDPVGAISAHGTCGIWGLVAVPLSNADATLGAQLYGTITIFAWTFIASLIFWGILKAVMGIRITDDAEDVGADVTECGIEAYPEFKK